VWVVKPSTKLPSNIGTPYKDLRIYLMNSMGPNSSLRDITKFEFDKVMSGRLPSRPKLGIISG